MSCKGLEELSRALKEREGQGNNSQDKRWEFSITQ